MPAGIRPTQNVVRKALFDILGDVEGLVFLELFAGSGAVGFEGVSRGVRDLTLVEQNRDCQFAIKKNMELLKAGACNLYPFEAQRAILSFHRDKRVFDIVFLDPPYHAQKRADAPFSAPGSEEAAEPGSGEDAVASLSKKTLQILGAYDILAPNGLVVVQHFRRDKLPSESGQLKLIKEAKYGSTLLSFYRKVAP